MKTKMTLLIVLCAIITLSFTFAATRNEEFKTGTVEKSVENEPIGGLVSERSL